MMSEIVKQMRAQQADLSFKYLPAFAEWVMNERLSEYAQLMLEKSREENIPILKLFSQYTDEQMIEMGRVSGAQLLQRLANNEAREHIDSTVQEWVSNRLQTIDRDAIAAEDIALISLVRRHVFRILLEGYAKDVRAFRQVAEEMDRFTAASDVASINAYIRIHQEKVQGVNDELELQRAELLEAQQLAQIGSFYWDMQGRGESVFTPMVFQIFEMDQTGNLESFIQDVHPDDRMLVRDAIDKAMNHDGVYECEYRYVRNNKQKRIWSRGLVSFDNGKPLGMKGTVMDTTMQSELLEKLQQSEELHKQAQALTHIGNWSWDIVTNEITWSDEMYRIYGLEPQSEIITFERFISLIHPDNRASRLQEIQRSLETGEAEDYVLHIVTPAKREKILKGKGEMILDKDGKPIRFNGTCQDITTEHRLNQYLREQEQYLAELINNAPDAVVVIDENSMINLWNPKAESIFGWRARDVIGRNLTALIIPEHSQVPEQTGILDYLVLQEENIVSRNTELSAVKKNLEEIYISLTISETKQDGQRSYIVFIRDITRERETHLELRNKTTLLEQKNRELKHSNEELESFNYAASHDLQEPLRKIQIFANRVSEEKIDLPQKLKSYIEKIISSSARMQSLINDLLLFSQTTSPDQSSEPVDLAKLLAEAKTTLAHRIEESGTRIEYASLPVVRVVAFQFLQVFVNLISNAIKYGKPEIAPVILIAASIVSDEELNIGANGPQARLLKISISDNGIGFDQRFAPRLFDLFARLHNRDKYSGTGIGLAICKKVVQNHQGFIRAESDGKNGATFSIFLPEERIVC